MKPPHTPMSWPLWLAGASILVVSCGDNAMEYPADQEKQASVTVDESSPADTGQSGAEIFATHCALCHGETGDGKGIAQLDRPARSFQEGAFSFGNTPEALFRTISAGIGGTPMPGFAAVLSADDRHRVAEYVLSLGPEQVPEAGAASILQVSDRPVFVRGQFRGLIPGVAEIPRGLMVGTLDGLSWQYRADDLRLMAVRQGGFVDRSDWGGRGGSPLKLLGKVVQLLDGGVAESTFLTAAGEPLLCRLRSTRIEGEQAWLDSRLVSSGAGNHPGLALVHERAGAASTASIAGYRRILRVEPDADSRPQLLLHLIRAEATEQANGPDQSTWLRFSAVDPPLVMSIRLYQVGIEGGVGHRETPVLVVAPGTDADSRPATRLQLPAGDAPLQVEWTTLLPTTLDDAAWEALLQEVRS